MAPRGSWTGQFDQKQSWYDLLLLDTIRMLKEYCSMAVLQTNAGKRRIIHDIRRNTTMCKEESSPRHFKNGQRRLRADGGLWYKDEIGQISPCLQTGIGLTAYKKQRDV